MLILFCVAKTCQLPEAFVHRKLLYCTNGTVCCTHILFNIQRGKAALCTVSPYTSLHNTHACSAYALNGLAMLHSVKDLIQRCKVAIA